MSNLPWLRMMTFYLLPTSRARDRKYKGNSNEKSRPKSNSAQVSQRPRSALNTFVKEVHDDNIGGLSDHDERFGEERRYVKASPLKRGQRLTSAVSCSRLLDIQSLNFLPSRPLLNLSRLRSRRNCASESRTSTSQLNSSLIRNSRSTFYQFSSNGQRLSRTLGT